MTVFKNYLDNEISFIEPFEGWIQFGGAGGNANPFRRHPHGGEFATFATLPPGVGMFIISVYLVNPLTPLQCSYAEMFVSNADGTEQLGVAADSGLILTDGTSPDVVADWTGYSTFGSVGSDLVASGTPNVSITSTAGGLFFIRLALWTA